MTRDQAWVIFAAACLAKPNYNNGPSSASTADEMLAEYDKRWDRVQQVVDVKPIAQPMVAGNPDLRGNEK